MHGRRLERLLVLDHRVLQLVAVVFRKDQLAGRVGARERDRVRLQGRCEVDKRLLDREELEEHFVGNGLVQLVLEVDRAQVDVVQVAQEQHASVPEQAKRKAVLVARRADAPDLVQKRRRDWRPCAADGDDGLSEEDDAERDGAVRSDLVAFYRTRDVHDQYGRVVVVVESRTFVCVEGVREEVARHVGKREHALEFRSRRLVEVYPAGRCKVLRLPEAAVLPPVDGDHGRRSQL